MRRFFLTIQYLFKIRRDFRFLILFLLAFPAAAVIAYFFPISGFYNVMITQEIGSFSSYGELWLTVAGRNNLQFIVLAAAYVLLIMSISAMTTLITRSMRVGKFQMKNPFYLINENVFAGFSVSTALIIAVFALHSLICLFIFLWSKILVGIVAFALNLLTIAIVLCASMFGASSLTLWLPIMTYYGTTPLKAFGLSMKKFYPYSKEFFSFYLVILVLILFFGFLGFLVQGVRLATWAFNAIGFTLAIELLVTFCIVSFFDTEGIEREDLAKKPYLRR